VNRNKKAGHSRRLVKRDGAGARSKLEALDIAGVEQPKAKGNAWEQQLAKKKKEEAEKKCTKNNERVLKGVKFMDRQIRQLIDEMRKMGGGPSTPVYYGNLFHATADSMPALSATIYKARERGVVRYDGNMLFQGMDDEVPIYLIRTEVEDARTSKYMRDPSYFAKTSFD